MSWTYILILECESGGLLSILGQIPLYWELNEDKKEFKTFKRPGGALCSLKREWMWAFNMMRIL